MKSLIRKFFPPFLRQLYGRFRRLRDRRKNQGRTAEEVFTDIYRTNRWGGARGEFCSGAGTTNTLIVSPYISMISEKAVIEGFLGLTFVDLGCGDFRVGRQLLPLCSKYIGVDIVEPLIKKNQVTYGTASAQFVHLDIVKDELPGGDVCFIRQVLQHLSNRQIATILKKLPRYKWVFITEHYPANNVVIQPNKDKIHGSDIRLYDHSGVYLTAPPFALPSQQLEQVLEVPGSEIGKGYDPGVIRTFLYRPGTQ